MKLRTLIKKYELASRVQLREDIVGDDDAAAEEYYEEVTKELKLALREIRKHINLLEELVLESNTRGKKAIIGLAVDLDEDTSSYAKAIMELKRLI